MTIHEDGKPLSEKWWDLKTEIQNQPKIKSGRMVSRNV
jgi:asparagine synthase (glutamine-hydrolysing)